MIKLCSVHFIQFYGPSECWLRTCDACVITTSRLGLRAPLASAIKWLVPFLQRVSKIPPPEGQWNKFATLETRRELGPKCFPQLFLGSLPGTRRSWSAIGQFFLCPSHNSRSFFSFAPFPQKLLSHTQAMVNQQFKTPVSYWSIFFLSQMTVPEVFAKVNPVDSSI